LQRASVDRPARRAGIHGSTRLLVRIALFGALGAAIAVVETFLPRPVPWMRLGLGHAAVLVALWTDGAGAALAVMLLKTGIAGLVGGTLGTPMTLVAVSAGVGAWAAMSLALHAGRRRMIGPVGVSVAGSAAYGMLQIWLVGIWLVGMPIWPMAPLILTPGVLAGAVTGLVAAAVLWRMGEFSSGKACGEVA
jgi:heptaprenyl diphosphate synthase